MARYPTYKSSGNMLMIFGNASAQPERPLMLTDLHANNKAVLGYSISSLSSATIVD